VNLHHLDGRGWEQIQPQLTAAKGIIFDARNEDSVYMYGVLAKLTDTEIKGERWCLPTSWLPDRVDVHWLEHRERIKPQVPRLRAQVAFLADSRNIGISETLLAFVEDYRLADIVGAPTAGALGGRNYLNMPGGYSASWTAYKVLKQDGSPRHGVSVQPTIAVTRTRRGVAEGKDEILLRALDVVRGRH